VNTVVHFNKSLTLAGATFLHGVQQACGGWCRYGYKMSLWKTGLVKDSQLIKCCPPIKIGLPWAIGGI